MNGNLLRYLAAGFLLIAILTGCERNTAKETESGSDHQETAPLLAPAERWQAPDFTLVSVPDGTVIASRDLYGKVTLVTFFSPWCADCATEMTMLQDLREEFAADRVAIVGMGIGGNEAEAAVKAMSHKRGITFPLLMSDETVRNGFGGVATEPTSFLVDKHGKIARKFVTHLDKETAAGLIRELLQEPE